MTKEFSILTVWALVLLLLGLTMISSTVLSGAIGLVVALGIAVAKSALVAWRYMHLDEQPALARLSALGAVAWLTILFSMTGFDYLTR
ncbi:caa(3)-type oxidase subunit IV (plasmid) [Rhizobium leguminosarum]|uniref:Caa(3)-type oxidase subunit IV n=1 Tax=Rhizobium leguminosarum TaxID=384 RepID=A0A4Q8XRK6_RHILE|nr:cytochrome C oxidase subunit IV family protein [Rhizobium leguminosarum]TAX22890.1 caa(3)-type oxidase subunit IV [Rhizobium leguminosarum]TAX45725.1 caa(3)-type oxidase subunit IV [Rhizobium leguminosarum]TAX46558.1 caa(3)-type oxidase subunit IV [Rhizobium leguminosarum]TAX64457.1 caa(3)-type oxidase subunit IV [Rhizobium leguminosarum]